MATSTTTTRARNKDSAGESTSQANAAKKHSPVPGLHTMGNQELQRLFAQGAIRAKLQVGSPDDPQEYEADQIARQVMDKEAPACSCASDSSEPCPACREQAGMAIRRKAKSGTHGESSGAAIGFGGGRPLAAAERDFFESRLDTDLGGVRIHTDSQAERSAEQLNARAFTLGSDIAFARGEYRPGSQEGRLLLAHELAHVALGHGGIRRNGGGNNPPVPALGNPGQASADFDPCAVIVPELNNRTLLQYFHTAQTYLDALVRARRRGEERYYDYGNLLRRLQQERQARARAGHVWLNANLTNVPASLWRLEASPAGNAISVTPGDTGAAAANSPVGNAVLLTPGQFADFLARENIPTVNPEEFFARQDPNAPRQPMQLPVPEGPSARNFPVIDSNYPFGLGQGGRTPAFGPWGMGAAGIVAPETLHVFDPYARPVVTGGQFGFGPNQVLGFRTDWRGDLGEALFAAQDPETLRLVRDLNRVQQNFPLYDPFDPRTGWFISIKTQLPSTPGSDPDLGTVQTAFREVLGAADPAKRASALSLLQANIDPTLTLEQMLLRTRFAVNPENVSLIQNSLENAIRRNPQDYSSLLDALMQQQPISVQHKDGTTHTYSNYASLRADFPQTPTPSNPRRMSEARFRGAVADAAQRARAQVIPNPLSTEARLRQLLDYRQRYDFSGASDFAGFPDTPVGRQQARKLQERYFRRISVPELLDVQEYGMGPVMYRAAAMGTAMAGGTTAVLQLPQMIGNWNQDPYAGRRYFSNVVLASVGGGAQASADQALRIYLSQGALDVAASRAASGGSVSALSTLAPAARFGGSTILGGVASGGITVGGMWLDESFFGADYTRIDYRARGTRAFVNGSVSAAAAAGGGALATAGATALAGGEGGAGVCTLAVPGVGTVACGTIGLAGGFIFGLGAYYLFDFAAGESIEGSVRETMGEQGCTRRTSLPP